MKVAALTERRRFAVASLVEAFHRARSIVTIQTAGPAITVGLAAVAGFMVVASTSGVRSSVPVPVSLSPALMMALVLLGGLTVVSLKRPLVWFGALLLWFPVGDLLRKLGSGDPRLVLGRDVLLYGGAVLLAAQYRLWRPVVQAMAGWWTPFLACVGFFVATAARSGFGSLAIPLSGLRLYFGYLPLLFVGWFIAQDPKRLARTVGFVATVLSVGTLVGVYQAMVGPDFLAPRADSTFFRHLDLLRRTAGQTGQAVFQPTGPFAEPGRFANWALVTFVVGLVLVSRRSIGRWRFVCLTIGITGLLIAAGRTVLITSALIPLAMVLGRDIPSGVGVRRVVPPIAFALLALLVASVAVPQIVQPRVEFLSRSLNPFKRDSELSTRPGVYIGGASTSIGRGGLFGRGVGDQSLGRQYVASDEYFSLGEGGFSTVALETGVIGLGLWLWWTAGWSAQLLGLRRRVDSEYRTAVSAVAFATVFILFVKFWLGVSAIQDYVLNAFLFASWGMAIGLSSRWRSDNSTQDEGSVGRENGLATRRVPITR